MTIHRTQGPAPEAWWESENPEPKVPDGYTPEHGLVSLEVLAEGLGAIKAAIGSTDRNLAEGVRYLVESMDAQALVDTVALIQDMKRALGVAEAYVSREVGYLVQEVSTAKTGQTSDGRPYEVMRGNTRKAWDHDGWQAEVRTKIVGESPILANAATGELIPPSHLFDMIAKAQAVHGAGAPKTTALKPLGIDPDEFCESIPGAYSVKITQTTTTPGA